MGKKKRADKKRVGKASFKRGGAKKPTSRRTSEASTAAPSSRVAALSDAEEAKPLPAKMFHDFNLTAMQIPSEAYPTASAKGKLSYTVHVQGATIDVLLKKRGFFVKRALPDGKRTTVSWGRFANPGEAWEEVKKVAGIKA